jgi:2-C-methyl-D-erythritol 4-phosphate cytidylyltransferase
MGLIGVRLSLVPGGVERADSVRAGVAALPASCSIVLIHDGARPFPQRAVIDGVIDACRAGEAAIAALPMHDTVKEAQPRPDGMHVTRRTVPRDHLWRAQTPQGFPRQLLERAYAERGDAVTDDAQAVERLGHDVVLIHDSTLNLKVTTADDLALAEALVEARK